MAGAGRNLRMFIALALLAEGACINIFFAYAKEELSCFNSSALEKLIGSKNSASETLFRDADMIVFLQLAHRPSKVDMDLDMSNVTMSIDDCEAAGGVGLQDQMKQLLENHMGTKHQDMKLVQIHQYSEDEPEEPDQSLLSIWYDSTVVTPGSALALKNILNGSSECLTSGTSRTGNVSLHYDKHVSRCTQLKSTWWQYASSKSSLITSWTPAAGGDSFAIFGCNLPSRFVKGKNGMLKRGMDLITSELGVSQSRVFILGDLNVRVLPDAYKACEDNGCSEFPTDTKKALALVNQQWETIPGRSEDDDDIDACNLNPTGATYLDVSGAFSNETTCKAALDKMDNCRRACIAKFACGANGFTIAEEFAKHDPKRGAGALDLLAEHFEFPPEKQVPSGEWRLPTYKRFASKDSDTCLAGKDLPKALFMMTCADNPCTPVTYQASDDATCKAKAAECFQESSESKTDMLPKDDPMYAKANYTNYYDAGEKMWMTTSVGYLDSFGWTKALTQHVTVSYFQDRPEMVMGDHGVFVAHVKFEESTTQVSTTGAGDSISTTNSANPAELNSAVGMKLFISLLAVMLAPLLR